jgi:hypothetical protein
VILLPPRRKPIRLENSRSKQEGTYLGNTAASASAASAASVGSVTHIIYFFSFCCACSSFQCTFTCDSGSDLNFYANFGTSGPNPTASSNDYAIEGASCGQTFKDTNDSGSNVVGLKYSFSTTAAYTNLVLKCVCLTEAETNAGGCFSGTDTVQVLDRNAPVPMRDLQVGDKVRTDGADTYEPVYSFGHSYEHQLSDFVQLETADGNSLSMTAAHLVYVNNKNSNPIRADQVQVGDQLAPSGGTVQKVSTVKKQGLFMPLTPSGKILVNNVQASAYISLADYAPIQQHFLLSFWLSEHMLSHLWLSPYRMYCMGISSNYCARPTIENNAVEGEEGILSYLLMGKKVAEFAMEQNLVVQVMLGLSVFGTLLVFQAIESIMGPSIAPLAILLVTVMLVRRRTKKAMKQKMV